MCCIPLADSAGQFKAPNVSWIFGFIIGLSSKATHRAWLGLEVCVAHLPLFSLDFWLQMVGSEFVLVRRSLVWSNSRSVGQLGLVSWCLW